MSAPVISVENLGKDYVLSHQTGESGYRTLRDTLGNLFRHRRSKISNQQSEIFRALHDVSFEVQPGEVLGIIGRNGAGKSTLLKILSRITEPTRGRVRLRGRVASLLEVGTGFHPELTGRENIFLNGAILGMTRAEIRKKFDEIVDFSGVEKFLDTPVKRYSSGMYVRLAFAVAAHLDPEILIIDEVLAVGDVEFQDKCLGKMRQISSESGRTVLFVSHNLPVVRRLCTSALVFRNGRIESSGPVGDMVGAYLEQSRPSYQPPELSPQAERILRIGSAVLENAEGIECDRIQLGQTWRLRVGFALMQEVPGFTAAVTLLGADHAPVQTAWTPRDNLKAGSYEAVFHQHAVHLQPGRYTMLLGISQERRVLAQYVLTSIDLLEGDDHDAFPVTHGAGVVLNSMETHVNRLSSKAASQHE